jgi:hypothetical protein
MNPECAVGPETEHPVLIGAERQKQDDQYPAGLTTPQLVSASVKPSVVATTAARQGIEVAIRSRQ